MLVIVLSPRPLPMPEGTHKPKGTGDRRQPRWRSPLRRRPKGRISRKALETTAALLLVSVVRSNSRFFFQKQLAIR